MPRELAANNAVSVEKTADVFVPDGQVESVKKYPGFVSKPVESSYMYIQEFPVTVFKIIVHSVPL